MLSPVRAGWGAVYIHSVEGVLLQIIHWKPTCFIMQTQTLCFLWGIHFHLWKLVKVLLKQYLYTCTVILKLSPAKPSHFFNTVPDYRQPFYHNTIFWTQFMKFGMFAYIHSCIITLFYNEIIIFILTYLILLVS